MDELYLDYATGALSEPARLLMDAHFALRPHARRVSALWEAVGAAMFLADLDDAGEAALDPDLFSRTLAQVEARLGPASPGAAAVELPGPLAEVVGRPLDRLEWVEAPSGALEFVMPRWPQARLIRVDRPQAPGWTLGPELSLVLKGALATADGVHRVGDVLLLDRAEAPPAPAADPALYFSVQDSGYSAREVRDTVARPGAAARDWAWRRV
jgi:putative transcriptional regulator